MKEYRLGMIGAIGCPVLWGILPIYWHALRPIDSWVIIVYRIFLVFIVSLIAAKSCYSRKRLVEPLRDRGTRVKYLMAGVMITVDWSVYIWAVNSDNVIQACIGNYMEPLMVCVFGIFFFHEKMTKYKTVAFVLVIGSVILILFHFGEIPTIALVLAVAFAVYSAIKKTVQQPPLISLLYETMFLAPPALIAIIYMEMTGRGAIGVGHPYQYGLLLLSGLFTVIPLWLFALAARRVSLVTLGLTEYISPTLSLIIGIFMFREPFDSVQFIAFAIIWTGLVFFTYGELAVKKTS